MGTPASNEALERKRALNREAVKRYRDRRRQRGEPRPPDRSRASLNSEQLERLRARERAWSKNNPLKVRNKQLKRRYGITLEQWTRVFEQQGRKCMACPTTDPGKHQWATDHDHETGQLRGILCHACNLLIGALGDCEAEVFATAERLLKYLRGPRPCWDRGGTKGPADASDTLVPWDERYGWAKVLGEARRPVVLA